MEKRRLKKSFKLGIIFAVLVLAIVAVLQLIKRKPIVHQEPMLLKLNSQKLLVDIRNTKML